jgi:O-antigen/teichoic acid export membrane protein
MVGVVHGFVIYWLLELLIDTSATGLFAACMTILTLSNPLILGLGNALGPRIARVATSEPEAAARALVHRSNLMVGGVLFLFAIGVALFGQWFLVRLYGSEFGGNFATLDLLALAFLIGGLSTATDYGLRAAERTDLSFYAGVAGLVVTVGASVPLILFLGVQGGAVGYLLGCLTTSLLRHVFFASITFGPHSEATP